MLEHVTDQEFITIVDAAFARIDQVFAPYQPSVAPHPLWCVCSSSSWGVVVGRIHPRQGRTCCVASRPVVSRSSCGTASSRS